jgi:ribosome-associated toxin RatA of RatAB toxin-antitoxin module
VHKRLIVLFLSITAVILAAPLSAASPCDEPDRPGTAWELSAQTPLAVIYQPANSAGSPPAALVRIKWDADPDLLYEIIWDYERFADFIPNVKSSRILAKQADRAWVYQQLHLPGPARDRHYVIVSNTIGSKPLQHHYRVEWNLSTQYPLPDAGLQVTPEHFRGCWNIEAETQRGLAASYWIELEPGGLLPRWVTQAALRHYITELMAALHQRLQSAPETQR